MQDLEEFYEEQWAPNASKATITIETAVEQKQHTVLRMINCLVINVLSYYFVLWIYNIFYVKYIVQGSTKQTTSTTTKKDPSLIIFVLILKCVCKRMTICSYLE